jgi:hypothetical protein
MARARAAMPPEAGAGGGAAACFSGSANARISLILFAPKMASASPHCEGGKPLKSLKNRGKAVMS